MLVGLDCPTEGYECQSLLAANALCNARNFVAWADDERVKQRRGTNVVDHMEIMH